MKNLQVDAHHEEAILKSVLLKTQAVSRQQLCSTITKQQQLLSTGEHCELGELLISEGYLSSEYLRKLKLLEGLIPGYTIEQKIGTGKFGVVYKAWQASLERYVAIKVLNPVFAQEATSIERFLREKHILGKLAHPHVIQGLDAGKIGEIYYLVLEYFPGTKLNDYILARGKLSEIEVFQIAAQLIDGLASIWKQGYIHRDLCPSNIMIAQEKIKICNFELSRLMDPRRSFTQELAVDSYCYLSPEQIRGHKLSFRSDCFALGAVLYQCLTGHPPFSHQPRDSIAHPEKRELLSPRNVTEGISRDTSQLVMRLLSPQAEKRCESIKSLEEEIHNLRHKYEGIALSSSTLAHQGKEIAFAIVMIALLCFLAFPQSGSKTPSNTSLPSVPNSFLSLPSRKTLEPRQVYELRAPSVVLIRSSQNLGAGVVFLFQRQKFILTNAHVIGNSSQVKIVSKNQQNAMAQVLSNNEVSDLALVSLPKELQDLRAIPLARPNQIQVGEDIIVIGHPKGYSWSLSRGTISGVRHHKIQIDAAINPGNSGGPILNRYGEMVGIVSFMIDQSDRLGFGISPTQIQGFLHLAKENNAHLKRFLNYQISDDEKK